MGPILLVVHVAAAILFIGPPAIAASMFPGYVPVAEAEEPRQRHARSVEVARVLHRISRVYGVLALIVPAAGIALAITWNKFGETWLIVAMVLTAVAGVLYAVRIVPQQAAALAQPPARRRVGAMSGLVGLYNILWVIVVVLMVLQPGGGHHS